MIIREPGMYLGYYGLAREPFNITPDPEFLYFSPSHKEALAAVTYGVAKRRGFIVITGEVGTGKTTILRAYLDRVNRQEVDCAYLFDPNLTFPQLLQVLLRELGHDAAERDAAWMIQWLHWSLVQRFRAERNVALIIDEAQNMPVETLEQLRMLSNLETAKEKLLQIVLVGQPELDRKLALDSLRQLKQRIAVRTAIQPLTREESRDYLRHRIEQAGGRLEEAFAPAAMNAIIKCGKGIPRTLNIIAGNALLAGFGSQQRPVPARIIREVVADLEGSRHRPLFKWALGACALLAFASGAFFGLTRLGAPEGVDVPAVSKGIAEKVTVPTVAIRPETPATSPSTPALSRPDHVEVAIEAPAEKLENRAAAEAPPPVEQQAPPSTFDTAVEPPPKIPEQADTLRKTLSTDKAGPRDANDGEPEPRSLLVPKVNSGTSGAAASEAYEPVPVTEGNVLTTRVVKPGDCLTKLIKDVYGTATDDIVEAVRRRNPQVTNPDIIVVGDTLVCPVIDRPDTTQSESVSEK